jgi:membrane-bound metal-dependent hydrolase YbcI (DUF457 family)
LHSFGKIKKNNIMFIGHFAVSFAAKKAAPKVSLATLFLATQFVDFLWPFLLLMNVEKVAIVPGHTEANALEFLYYPYTHSLLMGIVWGAVVGGIYWLVRKDSRGAIVIALCVLSHWFLDLIVHTVDLPLAFGDYKMGFGLWNHVMMTLIVETVIFIIGVGIYAACTKPKNKVGKWAFWGFVGFLILFNVSNTFGPPPASITMLAWSLIILMVVIIALAYWVDKNREVITANDGGLK